MMTPEKMEYSITKLTESLSFTLMAITSIEIRLAELENDVKNLSLGVMNKIQELEKRPSASRNPGVN